MGHRKTDVNAALNMLMFIHQFAYPWRYQTRSSSSSEGSLVPGAGSGQWWQSSTVHSRDFFLSENFGEFEFNWLGDNDKSKKDPSVAVRVLDGKNGAVVIEKHWLLASLNMGGPCAGKSDKEELTDNVSDASKLCVPHRGEPGLLRRALGVAIIVLAALILFFLKPAASLFVLWRLFLSFSRSPRPRPLPSPLKSKRS
jgi:hypothetical protein